jgi:hypothetical protein
MGIEKEEKRYKHRIIFNKIKAENYTNLEKERIIQV